MPLTTADCQALRAHLSSEFHRWVEDLLSRDELPLVGSAVPQRRCNLKTKAKKTMKTTATREDDKSTAPATPAPEIGQVMAPAASSHDDSSPEDGQD